MRCIDADALKDGYMHMGYDPNEHPEESYMEGWCKGFNAAVDHCIGHVIHAPTIEPMRKKGRWILDRSGAYCCSECMEPCASDVMMRPRDKFCKMCGAKMEGDTDETENR